MAARETIRSSVSKGVNVAKILFQSSSLLEVDDVSAAVDGAKESIGIKSPTYSFAASIIILLGLTGFEMDATKAHMTGDYFTSLDDWLYLSSRIASLILSIFGFLIMRSSRLGKRAMYIIPVIWVLLFSFNTLSFYFSKQTAFTSTTITFAFIIMLQYVCNSTLSGLSFAVGFILGLFNTLSYLSAAFHRGIVTTGFDFVTHIGISVGFFSLGAWNHWHFQRLAQLRNSNWQLLIEQGDFTKGLSQRVLPPFVWDRLYNSRTHESDSDLAFDCGACTVVIIGFGPPEPESDPDRCICDHMTTLYDEMDTLVEQFGGFTVEKLHNNHVSVFGLRPDSEVSSNEQYCTPQAAKFATDVIQLHEDFLLFEPEYESLLQIRIGIHSGSVHGCVIGSRKHPHFTILSDTVNVASRMMTSGCGYGEIQVSKFFSELLRESYENTPDGVDTDTDAIVPEMVSRGTIDVKGVGECECFLMTVGANEHGDGDDDDDGSGGMPDSQATSATSQETTPKSKNSSPYTRRSRKPAAHKSFRGRSLSAPSLKLDPQSMARLGLSGNQHQHPVDGVEEGDVIVAMDVLDPRAVSGSTGHEYGRESVANIIHRQSTPIQGRRTTSTGIFRLARTVSQEPGEGKLSRLLRDYSNNNDRLVVTAGDADSDAEMDVISYAAKQARGRDSWTHTHTDNAVPVRHSNVSVKSSITSTSVTVTTNAAAMATVASMASERSQGRGEGEGKETDGDGPPQLLHTMSDDEGEEGYFAATKRKPFIGIAFEDPEMERSFLSYYIVGGRMSLVVIVGLVTIIEFIMASSLYVIDYGAARLSTSIFCVVTLALPVALMLPMARKSRYWIHGLCLVFLIVFVPMRAWSDWDLVVTGKRTAYEAGLLFAITGLVIFVGNMRFITPHNAIVTIAVSLYSAVLSLFLFMDVAAFSVRLVCLLVAGSVTVRADMYMESGFRKLFFVETRLKRTVSRYMRLLKMSLPDIAIDMILKRAVASEDGRMPKPSSASAPSSPSIAPSVSPSPSRENIENIELGDMENDNASNTGGSTMVRMMHLIQADFCGFTALCQTLSATEISLLINTVFSAFDSIVEKHGGHRLQTAGDGYRAAASLEFKHAYQGAWSALKIGMNFVECLPDVARTLPTLGLDLDPRLVRFRVGVSSGIAKGELIGNMKPVYLFFGEAVDTVEKLERLAHPMTVLASKQTLDLVMAASRKQYTKNQPRAVSTFLSAMRNMTPSMNMKKDDEGSGNHDQPSVASASASGGEGSDVRMANQGQGDNGGSTSSHTNTTLSISQADMLSTSNDIPRINIEIGEVEADGDDRKKEEILGYDVASPTPQNQNVRSSQHSRRSGSVSSDASLYSIPEDSTVRIDSAVDVDVAGKQEDVDNDGRVVLVPRII